MSDPEPPSIWRIAADFLNVLYNLFGSPERIAFQHTHTLAQRNLILPWIRAGEALMRRLLLIEAGQILAGPTPPPERERKGGGPKKPPPRFVQHDPDAPESWRVSFHCFAQRARTNSSPACGGGVSERSELTEGGYVASAPPSGSPTLGTSPPPKSLCDFGGIENAGREAAGGGGRVSPQAKGFRSAWPIAQRYEALIRVFNNPLPYARRLARVLNALPRRAAEILKLPRRRRERQSGDVADLVDLIGRENLGAINDALDAVWGDTS